MNLQPGGHKGRISIATAQEEASSETNLPSASVQFAHNSERQFARLLDFYQIEWEYEPRSFAIEWDRNGVAMQMFTPDFYLPQYDLYIEITTLNQKLVTKKNRKVRRLRELYPEIKCKIFYQRDYLNLLVKYGLEEPSQGPLVATPPGDGAELFESAPDRPSAVVEDAGDASESSP